MVNLVDELKRILQENEFLKKENAQLRMDNDYLRNHYYYMRRLYYPVEHIPFITYTTSTNPNSTSVSSGNASNPIQNGTMWFANNPYASQSGISYCNQTKKGE